MSLRNTRCFIRGSLSDRNILLEEEMYIMCENCGLYDICMYRGDVWNKTEYCEEDAENSTEEEILQW